MTPAVASALRFVVFSAGAAALTAIITVLPTVGLPVDVSAVVAFALAALLKYVEARKRTA